MKVLMLDFDGVLNLYPNLAQQSRTAKFDKEACINLEFLLNKIPDLKIVVSSSWRHQGLDYVREVLQNNGIDPRKVIDTTSMEQNDDRGHHIEVWLKNHPEVTNFVTLDDNTDFNPHKDRLIKVKGTVGLTQANVEKAIKLLNK